MRAMILAAGRGERMRPLTDHTPKPLLPAGGKPLIVWHIERLVAAGICDIAINLSWLGTQIPERLGDGNQYGARIAYSNEPSALETAGGIAQALPLLGQEPFLVINGDIWCDWDPVQAGPAARRLAAAGADAWVLLVDNPEHHPDGDFVLQPDGYVASGDTNRLTFAGIGIYRPRLFANLQPGPPAPLAPLLRQAMSRNAVLGNHHAGAWTDVGTPQRLEALNARLDTAPGG